jgi:aconitase A
MRFRRELFDSPELLGREIAANSWRGTQRFQNLAEGCFTCMYGKDWLGDEIETSLPELQVFFGLRFDVEGINHSLEPGQRLSLCIRNEGGVLIHSCSVLCRLDTDDEIRYFNHGGLLPQLLSRYLNGRRRCRRQ